MDIYNTNLRLFNIFHKQLVQKCTAKYIIQNNFDARRAIGAEQLCAYLGGKVSHDVAIENWITKTNRYAKRQRTWFKTQFFADVTINHVPTDSDLDLII